MKNWLTKLSLSFHLDSRKPIPPRLQQRIDASPELHRFAQASAGVHDRLKASHPTCQPPPSLHRSIMHEIQNSRRTEIPKKTARLVWLPASLVAVFALGLLSWLHVSPAPTPALTQPVPQTLAQAAVVLDSGEQLTSTLPDSLLAPLSQELQRLNHDLDQTGQLLLASLP